MIRKRRRVAVVSMLLLGLTGCSIQDSTQPAENSISAGPKSDQALVKAKKGSLIGKPAGKSR